MSRWLALTLLVGVSAAAEERVRPFPLPSVDGKALGVTEGQKRFRVPMGFAKVERFYREQLGAEKEVRLTASGASGQRTLTLQSKRPGDAWSKAVVKEGAVDTTIEVTFLMRLAGEKVDGAAPPVQFIFGRSPEAAKAAAEIDHFQRE